MTRPFTLLMQDATHAEQLEDVVSFVSEDASGQFGVLAGHTRLMTVLTMGLSRFRRQDKPWEYVAVPGGLLYFVNNTLTLSCAQFWRDTERERLTAKLDEQIKAEQAALHDFKESLLRLEKEMFRRLLRDPHAQTP